MREPIGFEPLGERPVVRQNGCTETFYIFERYSAGRNGGPQIVGVCSDGVFDIEFRTTEKGPRYVEREQHSYD